MNLAAWVAIYLILVLLSIAVGFFFGWNCGDYAHGTWPEEREGLDLDKLDTPTKGAGEL